MARQPKTPPQVTPYSHDDRRVMNPEVGLVKPSNDPEIKKTKWAFDPHLDPVLQFDIGRAQIEALIDTALVSGDKDKMQAALSELKRMQAPYLNWTGKAERTSFEVDTVSLHVHERIAPATILEGVKKRLGTGPGMAEAQMDFFHTPVRGQTAARGFGVLQARQGLVEPADFRRQPVGDELAAAKREHARAGADDLHRPALWH